MADVAHDRMQHEAEGEGTSNDVSDWESVRREFVQAVTVQGALAHPIALAAFGAVSAALMHSPASRAAETANIAAAAMGAMQGVCGLVSGGGSSSPSSREAVDRILATTLRLTGKCMDITEAKRWMRSFGSKGQSLASALGKISKHGNGQAHPAVERICASLELLVQGQCEQAASDSAEGSPEALGDDAAFSAATTSAKRGRIR